MIKKILKFANKHATVSAVLITVIFTAAVLGISWLSTCGLVKLITMCFGWTFDWGIATGIWLLTCLARTVFNHTVTVKK